MVVVGATAVEHPYSGIVKRNAFKLTEPKERPLETTPALPNFKLKGITSFGDKQAFLKVQTLALPSGRGDERWLVLKEGEREGDIEVVRITRRAVDLCWGGRPITVKYD